jgi:hypothetical protein
MVVERDLWQRLQGISMWEGRAVPGRVGGYTTLPPRPTEAGGLLLRKAMIFSNLYVYSPTVPYIAWDRA